MFLTIYVFCVTLLSWWMLTQRRRDREPPACPGAVPILGHALVLLGDSIDLWEVLKRCAMHALEAGGVSRLILGPKTFYLVSDPEDCVTILTKCLDKSYVYNLAKDWVGNGLITAELSLWKRNRKLFSPAFAVRILDSYMDIYNKQARKLVDLLAAEVGKENFNPYLYMSYHVVETVSRTTLGHRNKEKINKEYVHEIDALCGSIIEKIQKPWLLFDLFYKKSDMKIRREGLLNKAKDLTYSVIRKRKLDLQNTQKENITDDGNSDSTKSILDFILNTPIRNEISLDEDIRQQLETFIIAGYDTTSTTLVYALKNIGTRPDIQKRICEEIKEVLGDSHRDIEKDDLTKLVYLEAVAKETIRLYPTVPMIGRTAHEDIQLKNYTIRSGSTVVGAIYGVNRHASWGEDAEEFNPERWLSPKRVPPGLFMSFSHGRRNCLGEVYALRVLKTTLVHILRRYHVKAENKKEVLKFNVFLKPVSGFDISLELRS